MIARTLRVPRQLWEAALAKSDERGENLSEEIRKFLTRYVAKK